MNSILRIIALGALNDRQYVFLLNNTYFSWQRNVSWNNGHSLVFFCVTPQVVLLNAHETTEYWSEKLAKLKALSFPIKINLLSLTKIWPQKIQIALTTLEWDLVEFLYNEETMTRINIQYAENIVLSLKITRREDIIQNSVEITGNITLKSRATKKDIKKLSYINGKFTADGNQLDSMSHLILKRQNSEIPAADRTIRYLTQRQLMKELEVARKESKQRKKNKEGIYEGTASIGDVPTRFTYDPVDKIIRLKKPLKGVSFEENGVPDVFFDVWYRPTRTSYYYGSSSGFLTAVDALRVYHEYLPINTSPVKYKSREVITLVKLLFKLALVDAYDDLIKEKKHVNGLIGFNDKVVYEVLEIVLEKHSFLYVEEKTPKDKKTRMIFGQEIYRILKDNEFPTDLNSDVTMRDLREKTFKKFYYGWKYFEGHLRVISRMMVHRCVNDEKYYFNVHYREGVLVVYDCTTKMIAVRTIMTVVVQGPEGNIVHIGEYHSITCITCVDGDIYVPAIDKNPTTADPNTVDTDQNTAKTGNKPFAIIQEPLTTQQTYADFLINMKLFAEDLNTLRSELKQWYINRIYHGSILIDDKMLLSMEVSQDQYVFSTTPPKVSFHLTKTSSEKLEFDGEKLEGKSLSEVLIYPKYFEFKDTTFIASLYLTVKQLQTDLKAASKEALDRCNYRTNKTYLMKFVYHKRFSFKAYYSCEEEAFFFPDSYRALWFDRDEEGRIAVLNAEQTQKFLYLDKDGLFFLPKRASENIFAFQIPETEYRKLERFNILQPTNEFGAPLKINDNLYLFLKSDKKL